MADHLDGLKTSDQDGAKAAEVAIPKNLGMQSRHGLCFLVSSHIPAKITTATRHTPRNHQGFMNYFYYGSLCGTTSNFMRLQRSTNLALAISTICSKVKIPSAK